MPLATSVKKAAGKKTGNTVKKLAAKPAHTAPAAKKRGRPAGSKNKVTKASAKSTAPKTTKKGAGRKAKSLEQRRKDTRDSVRRFRAEMRAKGLTYNTKIGKYVPYKSKATMQAAKKRAGKNSPLWGKRPANLKSALAKRKQTLAKRKPGYTKFGRKRLPRKAGGRIGKRPMGAPKTKKAAAPKAAAAPAASGKKRGRPAKAAAAPAAPAAKRRGRPAGSKNKSSAEKTIAAAKGFLTKRGRGRPRKA